VLGWVVSGWLAGSTLQSAPGFCKLESRASISHYQIRCLQSFVICTVFCLHVSSIILFQLVRSCVTFHLGSLQNLLTINLLSPSFVSLPPFRVHFSRRLSFPYHLMPALLPIFKKAYWSLVGLGSIYAASLFCLTIPAIQRQ
jgi:hypothetical protein